LKNGWSKRGPGFSLRTRILILLLIAVLPAIGIQGYNEYQLRRAREHDIRQQVIQITKQFGEEMGELREGARQLLLTLGQLPDVREKDGSACTALFKTLQHQYENYALLGAADAQGQVFCSSALGSASQSVAEEDFYKRAIGHDGLAVGNYSIDPVTGQKEIHFAIAFKDKSGRIGGVVFAGLDLKWLTEHLKERGLSPTASILIADRLGNIISRLPNSEAFIGKNMRDTHEAIMDGNAAGSEEATGVDGVTRIFGYVPAQLPPYDLFLSAGQSKAEAMAPIAEATLRGIGLIALGVTLAAYLAWHGSRIFLQRPLSNLLDATKQWRAGDYAHRVEVGDKGSEIGALSQAFNDMANGLAQRDQAQKQAELQLRQFNTSLEERVTRRTDELAQANRLLKEEIAQRERAQAELTHLQKLEAIGRLTSGIAHDFNNLLTAILGNLEIARCRTLDEKTAKALDTATRVAWRGAKLVRDLLAFSRRQHLDLRSIDVNELLGGAEELFDHSLGPIVRVELRRTPRLWQAVADPVQLELATLNLAINARDAMPNGGTVTISTANVWAGDPRLPEELCGEFVMLAVTDTGMGMSEEVRDRVFEPFFTTKAIGKGNGLGLSMVYGLVMQCRGGVRIDSRVGHGTTIAMFFPRAREEPRAHTEDSSIESPALNYAGAEVKLLVVDDDADVRSLTATALREAGFVVREAKDAVAGLEALKDEANIALLITDYAMPGINGADLFRHAKALRPDIGGLLITGFGNLPQDNHTLNAMRILRKPFQSAQIAEVNWCLRRGPLNEAA
jgi:signal transduction histidine kinase/CheY-like chemotaxis protein